MFELTPLIGKFKNIPWLQGEIRGKKIDQSKKEFIVNNFSKMLWEGLNTAFLTEELPDKDIDYVGRWEDAFLYNGFENGKYRFLTPAILQRITRHGFLIKCNYHDKKNLVSKNTNYIIEEMHWKGISCIPEKDINGNTVNVGYTDPRLYLPDIIQKLFDEEFGYDKEVEDVY